MKIQEKLLSESVYREYNLRWFQLYLFLSALVSNIIFGFALSPIVKEISIIYGIDDNYIQLLIVSFTLFSAIMIIPGNMMSEAYGIRSIIAAGCILTLIGAIVSVAFVKVSFWFVYLGQVISLIGFPFRLITASKFTANWFHPQSRIIIMVIISLFFNASSGIAIRIPLWVLGDYTTDSDDKNFTQGKALIEELVYLLGGIAAALTIPPILFFSSRPLTPPSFTASDQCVRENYAQAGRELIKNKDYLYLATAFPLIVGTIVLLTIQMEYVVHPFDYSLEDISNCVVVGVISGLIGDITVGTIVKKTGHYKRTLRACNALVTFFFFLLIIALLSEVKLFFIICYGLVCGCSAVLALTFELACEISFPVSENSTIAYLGLFGNLINFLQSIPEIFILKCNNKTTSIITLFIMFGFIASGNWFTYKVNENLRRLQIDEERQRKEDNSSLQTIE